MAPGLTGYGGSFAARHHRGSSSSTHGNSARGINYIDLMLKASIPVKIIVLLLLLGSFTSWVIIFRKARVFKQANREADQFENRFWSGTDLSKLYASTNSRKHMVSGLEAIFEGGFREFTRLRERRRLDPRIQIEGAQRVMRTNFMREMDQLERNLELLANIGSTAPYVGLVGTVFGIMVTMHDMISSGDQAGIAAVALVFPKRCLLPQLVCLLRFRRCGLTTVLPLV